MSVRGELHPAGHAAPQVAQASSAVRWPTHQEGTSLVSASTATKVHASP